MDSVRLISHIGTLMNEPLHTSYDSATLLAPAHDRDASLADGATHYLAQPVGLHTLGQVLAPASTVPSF